MARVFISPSRYVQGPGELARLGEYTKAYGVHALVIISAGGLRRFGDALLLRNGNDVLQLFKIHKNPPFNSMNLKKVSIDKKNHKLQ